MKLAAMSSLNDDLENLKKLGYGAVQLRVDSDLSDEECGKIRGKYESAGLKIIAVGRPLDFLEGDAATQEKRIDEVKAALIAAPKLGANVVITWGGYKKPGMDLAAARKKVMDAFSHLLPVAEDNNAYLTIELYDRCVIGTPAEIVEAIDEIGSDYLKIAMDPPNVFKESDLNRMDEAIGEIVDAAEGNIIIAHAKDMIFKDGKRELPYAGAGVMDYSAYIRALKRVGYDHFLVTEHHTSETIKAARDYVLKALKSIS